MKTNLETTNPALVPKYTWTRPRPPPSLSIVDTFDGVKQVLGDTDSFMSAYDGRLFTVAEPVLGERQVIIYQFRIIGKSVLMIFFKFQAGVSTLEDEERVQNALDACRKKFTAGTLDVSRSIFVNPDLSTADFFGRRTSALIREKSYDNGGMVAYVDIVKDVINAVPIHWVCQEIVGLCNILWLVTNG